MQALLESLGVAPWMVELFSDGFETVKGLWHTIESILLLIGLWWISRRLKIERTKFAGVVDSLGERVETFGQFAKAARDAAEAATPEQPDGGAGDGNGLSNWEVLRSEWQEMRDRIELAVQRISHKQVREKYSKINRYSYYDVIVTLGNDEEIRPLTATVLLNMNQKFLALRSRPQNTTPGDVAQFRAWKSQINGALPKLPKPKPPPGPQGGEPPKE